MTDQTPLELDGSSLTVAGLIEVAEERRPVRLSAAARTRMGTTRAIVEGIAARGEVVYGVTTGFGKLSDFAIPPDQLAQLQVNLVRSHAAGVGPRLPEREVRAMMLLRANVLAKGFSGARPELAELLCEMLNHGLYPPVPEQGSVGASGDLAPLAHLALSLIGEGDLNSPVQRGAPRIPRARNNCRTESTGSGFTRPARLVTGVAISSALYNASSVASTTA